MPQPFETLSDVSEQLDRDASRGKFSDVNIREVQNKIRQRAAGRDANGTSEEAKETLKICMSEFVKLISGRKIRQRILLLGPQGVGKSSLINTFAAALSGNFEMRSSCGGGDQINDAEDALPGNTRGYHMFRKCGLVEDGDDEDDESGLQDMRQNLEQLGVLPTNEQWDNCLLPDICDAIGFPNEYNQAYVDVLKRCLYGLVKDGDDLHRLLVVAQQHKQEGLERIFPFKDVEGDAERRITRLAVVLDANYELQSGFLQTAMAAANSPQLKIPVVVIMTKVDLLNAEMDNDAYQKFEKLKSAVARLTHIEGVMNVRYDEVINYCDTTATHKIPFGYENDPQLDTQAISCLCKLVNPRLRAHGMNIGATAARTVEETIQREDDALHRVPWQLPRLRHPPKVTFLMLLMPLIAYAVYLYLNSGKLTNNKRTSGPIHHHKGNN